MILLTAVPFGDAVLGTGALVGISPYLLLQWIVPVATETPELVVAFVLLTHGRGGQSVAVLLAGAVSQYTLALGTLPIAYLAAPGTGPLPLAGRERVELLLSIGVALYAVAALVTLRLSRGDTAIMLALFSLQFLLPRGRHAAGARVGVPGARRRRARRTSGGHLPALVRCAASSAEGAGPRGGARTRDRGRSRRARWRTRSRAAAAARRSPPATR